MERVTKELLLACARVKWKHTYNPVADAIKVWQAAGCPDMPGTEDLVRPIMGIMSSVVHDTITFEGAEKDVRREVAKFMKNLPLPGDFTPIEADQELTATPGGDINNCSLANGDHLANCQVCVKACPYTERLRKLGRI